MKLYSRTIALLPLALAMPLGCASEPSTDVDDSVGPSGGRSGEAADVLDERLAQRARISASGQYRYKGRPQPSLAPSTDSWEAALDIHPDYVVAASITGPAAAAGTFTDLGVIKPIRQGSFVLLSTGIAGTTAPEPGTDFDPINSVDGDSVTLTLDLMVPPGANRMSLQYNFLSSESPDFLQSQYNDTFSIQLIDANGTRDFMLASVNSSEFFEASDTRAKDSGFDIYTDDPANVDTIFGPTGLPDAGLTDFQGFNVPVIGGAPLRVQLNIKDNGDGILDSAVLLDALEFSALETIDPNPDLIENGRLNTSFDILASQGPRVRGAIADGVTEILLRMKVAGPGSVTFSIPGPVAGQNGTLSTIGGTEAAAGVATQTVTTASGEYAFAMYRVPADFHRGLPEDTDAIERAVRINASFTPQGGAAANTQIDLQLRRPPIVMAHGPWARTLDWSALDITRNPTFAITYLDHAYTCDEELRVSFMDDGLSCPMIPAVPPDGRLLCESQARATVRDATREALYGVHRLGLAGTKVDMIAHGSGGVLARRYLDAPDYQNATNRNFGDVNRLITISTPHFGSRVADKFVTYRDGAGAATQFLCQARRLAFAPLDRGDIDLMTTASSTHKASSVPAHAIIGAGLTQGTGSFTAQNVRLRLGTMLPLYTSAVGATIAPTFGTAENDLFSTADSQKGGLTGTAVTTIPLSATSYGDFYHTMTNPTVSPALVTLLNSPIAGGSFGTFAASPTPFAPALAAAALETPRAPSLLPPDAGLRIVSPVHNQLVVAGSTIPVQVAADNFTPVEVFAIAGDSYASSTTAPFTVNLPIPTGALGRFPIIAFALDANDDFVVSNTVVLSVTTSAVVQDISIITQNPILFGGGRMRQLVVAGTYSDGAIRDITPGFLGTTYRSSNESIVKVSADGLLLAVGTGIATVAAQNNGVQDSITVTVRTNTLPLAVAKGDLSMTCVEAGSITAVALDGSESFDPDGQALTYTWLENGVEIASGATPTVDLATGVHTITLQVSDGEGGTAATSLTISLLADTAAPQLVVLGDDPRTLECGSSYTDAGATANDACEGNLTGSIVADSNVNTAVPGDYTVEYDVADSLGHASSATRTVRVRDTQAPSLTLLGYNPVINECGLPYSDPGATASDVCAGDLTSSILAQSTVNASVPGTYAVNYSVGDGSGGLSTASRQVTIADTQAPSLTVLGSSSVTLECGSSYTDSGATASDVCAGNLTSSISTSSTVNAGEPGDYSVSYSVQDGVGLTAAGSRSVAVRDTQAPAITLLGANPLTHECRTAYVDPGATASDACDGNLTSRLTSQSNVNPNAPGTYSVSYEVRDDSNLLRTASRSVVVADHAAPVVTVDPMKQLWPSSLAYQYYTLADCGAAVDACTGNLDLNKQGEIIAIHSDEPDSANFYDPPFDIIIYTNNSFLLRRQKLTPSNGRVYEVEFTVRDPVGNQTAPLSCFVGVKASATSPTPVNDGRVFTVTP